MTFLISSAMEPCWELFVIENWDDDIDISRLWTSNQSDWGIIILFISSFLQYFFLEHFHNFAAILDTSTVIEDNVKYKRHDTSLFYWCLQSIIFQIWASLIRAINMLPCVSFAYIKKNVQYTEIAIKKISFVLCIWYPLRSC